MKSVAKLFLLKMRPVLFLLLSFFYEKKYLSGQHFESGLSGFLWAFKSIWIKNILRLAQPHPWPTALTCHLSNSENISFHPDDLNNFQSPGTYFQNFNGFIHIGRGTYIAPNVGLITVNHKSGDLASHEEGEDIVIGEKCWIGMNSVILPGVELGSGTVVAAGAVVTKSFLEGNKILAGVPAKIIKDLDT